VVATSGEQKKGGEEAELERVVMVGCPLQIGRKEKGQKGKKEEKKWKTKELTNNTEIIKKTGLKKHVREGQMRRNIQG